MTNSEARKRHANPPTDQASANTCEHYYCWSSPAGSSHSARICMSCHEPDPEWLNEILGDRPHATPPTPDAEKLRLQAEVDEARGALDDARAEVQRERSAMGQWRRLAHERLAHVTAAESARDAAEGAIERVRAVYVKACSRSALPNGWTVDDWEDFAEGLLHDVSFALAPVTTDETEGGGVDE